MVGCSIRKCKSRSVKGGTIMFFSFPTNESVAKEWLRYCGPKTTTKNGRVCSNHFSSSDYKMKSLQHIFFNESPRKIRKLKPDALPTLLIGNIEKPDALPELEINDKDKETQNTPNTSIEITKETVDTSDNLPELEIDGKDKETQNMHNTSMEIARETAGSPDSITSFPEECDTTPAKKIVRFSNVVESSDGNTTIPLSELKRLQKTATEFNVLKNNLSNIFTSGQVRCLMKSKKRRVTWSAEDITAAISLRSVSPRCYHYLRVTIGIPLPAFSTLRKWESNFEKKGIRKRYIDEIQSRVLTP